MDPENPNYHLRNFRDRLWGAREWLNSYMIFRYLVNYYMKQALNDLVPYFDFYTYSSSALMSFSDMPQQLHMPVSLSNEVGQCLHHKR